MTWHIPAHLLRAAVAGALLVLPPLEAAANPNGPQVVSGSASITSQGSTLTVTNSPGSIINWQGFSIGAGESTRFVQQSSSSAVLNRVVGPSISSIMGSLQSNGRVFLTNPNGVLITPGASIDTSGFTATTSDISNADFNAGRTGLSGTGSFLSTDGRIGGSSVSLSTGGIAIGDLSIQSGSTASPSLTLSSAGTITQSGLLSTPVAITVSTGQTVAFNSQVLSIGSGPNVTFVGTPGSVTLNSVVGPNPSTIFGSLQGNGSVFLLNPQGISISNSSAGRLVQTSVNVSSSATAFTSGATVLTSAGVSGGFSNLSLSSNGTSGAAQTTVGGNLTLASVGGAPMPTEPRGSVANVAGAAIPHQVTNTAAMPTPRTGATMTLQKREPMF